MDLTLIVFIAIAVIAGFFAFRILENVIKAIMAAAIVMALLLGAGIFLAVADAKDFAENFPEGPNIGLLVNESEVLAGAVFSERKMDRLDDQEISNVSGLFEEGKYDEIKGDRYKLVIIESSVTGGSVEDGASSDDFWDALSNVSDRLSDDPIFFVSEIKKGNIRVYEETALFKAVKLFPASLTKQLSNRLSEAVRKISYEDLRKIEIQTDKKEDEMPDAEGREDEVTENDGQI